MKPFVIERAENLSAMLNAFSPQHLNEINLPRFFYDNTMPIRMGHDHKSPLNALFEDCSMLYGSNAHLLSGHGGCGKSTELINLKRRFEEDGQPVGIIQSELEMNMHFANCWDIMLHITDGLCNIASKNNIELPKATLRAVYDYINKDKEVIDTTYEEASFGIGVVLNLFASIKSSLQFGEETRTIIREKMERRASDWLRYVAEIADTISNSMNGKRPILIFEGLEKIQPYERAFEIFQYDTLAKMPFPIIYTFPISLTYDPKFAPLESFYKVRFLPMIKVSNSDKGENKKGIDVIRKIVELRADLRLFDKDVLEELIRSTGGVLRHLFECIIDASRTARWRGAEKIEKQDAKLALSDLSIKLSRRISMADYDVLKKIYRDSGFRKQIEDKDSLLKLMQALVVLEYQNNERWHDLHPLIAEYMKRQGVFDENN